jgi:formylglycine-generating enzyme required for sulfatase activity
MTVPERRWRWIPWLVLLAATTMVLDQHLTAIAVQDVSGAEWPEFIEIAEGPFVMGADRARDPQAFDNERWSSSMGEGTVHVPTFYLSRHEITVAQFGAFARAPGVTVDPRALASPPAHPVAFVSWPDALEYCRWLARAIERSPSAPPAVKALLRAGWQVTLPTEAEWEKAARGTDRRIYPWGAQPLRARANFQNSNTTPVGQFPCPECPYGLTDMSGNVWEWTRSPYQPYPYNPDDDRDNLHDDALWVIRGGGFTDDARLARTTARTGADPGARRAFIGFRVALSRPSPR